LGKIYDNATDGTTNRLNEVRSLAIRKYKKGEEALENI
jgi:hypothetical protein